VDILDYEPTPEGAVTAFRKWYERAVPGETIIYYRGFLREDVEGKGIWAATCQALRNVAQRHADAGLVSLRLKRLDSVMDPHKRPTYAYYATRITRRAK
jgi:hypothetical protein